MVDHEKVKEAVKMLLEGCQPGRFIGDPGAHCQNV